MGLSPFKKSCFNLSNSQCKSYEKVDDINPNPFIFKIKRYEQFGEIIVAEINYPNCTNYEGNKIIVLEGISTGKLKGLKCLDPHFSKNFPILARFKPTQRGWALACVFANNLKNWEI